MSSMDANRINAYKYRNQTSSDLRQQRIVNNVSLRRSFRRQQLCKLRSIDEVSFNRNSYGDHSWDSVPIEVVLGLSQNIDEGCTLHSLRRLRYQLCLMNTTVAQNCMSPWMCVGGSTALSLTVKVLGSDVSDMTLKFEAAWVLTNLVGMTGNDGAMAMIHAGIIDFMVPLLRPFAQAPGNVREQIVWLLGNLVSSSSFVRDTIISAGLFECIIELLRRHEYYKMSLMRNATWALSGMCHGKGDDRPDFSIIHSALPVLARLLFFNDIDVQTDASWALAYIAEGGHSWTVVQAGVVRRLNELLSDVSNTSEMVDVYAAYMRAIGFIIADNVRCIDVCVEVGVIDVMLALTRSNHNECSDKYVPSDIIRDAWWILSTIAAVGGPFVGKAIDSKIVASAIHSINEGDYKVSSEAAWCLLNILEGASQSEFLKIIANESKLVSTLAMLLKSQDFELVSAVAESLFAIVTAELYTLRQSGHDCRMIDEHDVPLCRDVIDLAGSALSLFDSMTIPEELSESINALQDRLDIFDIN